MSTWICPFYIMTGTSVRNLPPMGMASCQEQREHFRFFRPVLFRRFKIFVNQIFPEHLEMQKILSSHRYPVDHFRPQAKITGTGDDHLIGSHQFFSGKRGLIHRDAKHTAGLIR